MPNSSRGRLQICDVFKGGDGEPVYVVLVGATEHTPDHECVSVWVDNGQSRCTECSTGNTAMSASCRHARTVKRAIRSGRLVLSLGTGGGGP
jgi:hypothetical protein